MQIKKPFSEKLQERFSFQINDDQYRLAFKSELKKHLGPNTVGHHLIIEQLIIEWDDFVTLLEVGYDMSSYEFEYEMDLQRETIDFLANSASLCRFPEHKSALQIIGRIDNRFKAISKEHSKLQHLAPWWRKRFLTRASSEYFDTMSIDLTTIKIEQIDK